MYKREETGSWFKRNLCWIIFGIIIGIYHLFITTDSMDDIAIYGGLRQLAPLPTWLKFRYDTWTSRIIIDAMCVMLVEWNVWIFRIINWICWMAILYCIADLMQIRQKKQAGMVFIVQMLLLYPFYIMQTAGWCATSVNYLWPFAMGIVAIDISYMKLRGGGANPPD